MQVVGPSETYATCRIVRAKEQPKRIRIKVYVSRLERSSGIAILCHSRGKQTLCWWSTPTPAIWHCNTSHFNHLDQPGLSGLNDICAAVTGMSFRVLRLTPQPLSLPACHPSNAASETGCSSGCAPCVLPIAKGSPRLIACFEKENETKSVSTTCSKSNTKATCYKEAVQNRNGKQPRN